MYSSRVHACGIHMYIYFWNLLLLFCSAILGHDSQSVIECDGLFLRGKYYDKHMLFEAPGKPYNMFLDRLSGHLIFSNTLTRGTEISFDIISCHIERLTCRPIPDIREGYAIGYDPFHDEVYLGGGQGLYTYNVENNVVNFFAERGKSIWSIFIRRNFYYIQHPSQQLYVRKRGKFVKVNETIGFEIDHFFVSKDFDVYFSNRSGLYKAELNRKGKLPKPYLLTDKVEVRQITEDIYGIVYFCASDGIYVVDRRNRNKINKIANIDQAFSITFAERFHLASKNETNQLIYSDKHAIYVLVRNNHSDLCSRVYKLRKTHTPVKLLKVAV